MNREQLDGEAAEIDRLLTEAVETKSYGDLADLERRVTALADARSDLERKTAMESDPRYAALRGFGGDAGTEPVVTSKAMTGAQLNPLSFSDASLNKMYKAFKD